MTSHGAKVTILGKRLGNNVKAQGCAVRALMSARPLLYANGATATPQLQLSLAQLSNLLQKSHSRRLTLSLCGLQWETMADLETTAGKPKDADVGLPKGKLRLFIAQLRQHLSNDSISHSQTLFYNHHTTRPYRNVEDAGFYRTNRLRVQSSSGYSTTIPKYFSL